MLLGASVIEAEAREYEISRLIQCIIRTVSEAQSGIFERSRRLANAVFDGSRTGYAGVFFH